MPQRDAWHRFGGAYRWTLPDGRQLTLGDVITGEGPGQGVTIVPSALDRYEAALRLRPQTSWLLRRLLGFHWQNGAVIFPSFRKISRESGVSRSSLWRWLKELERLGYAKVVGGGPKADRRLRLSLDPLFAALAICIALDPQSEWSKRNGGPISPEEAAALSFDGKQFDLNMEAFRVRTKFARTSCELR